MTDMSDEMFDAVKAVVNFSRNDARYISLAERKGADATQVKTAAQRLEYFDARFAEIAADHNVDAGELRRVMQQLMEPKMAAELKDMEERGYKVSKPTGLPGRA